MDHVSVSELVERLGSDEDAVRKMAVFKLQSNIGDPSFADVFIQEGGLTRLRYLTLNATGNTLAYSLTSFSRLLEVDMGWDYVNQDLRERVVELVVTHPLVNILRGAMSILVHIVSHPHTASTTITQPDSFGFQALKPAIAAHPHFLEMLVSRLYSADHTLCANAMQLINSLTREAIADASESEWPKFIKRLQDLGVIKAVYNLMQSTALQDLAHPLLEFQALTKVLLRKWRDLSVDLEKSDHRRALKTIHAASNPDKPSTPVENDGDGMKRKHNPEKWRRLGFETETPAWEFEETGYLGIMDLTDYVRKNEDSFQKLLLEQSTKPAEQRCPFSRASLAITAILYEHFEVETADVDDAKYHLAFESRNNFDKVFKPLILQWSLLHTAGLHAFFRLWQTAGAELEDFMKIFELVRILLEVVVGTAARTKDVQEVQTEIAEYELSRLRQLQMELLEVTYEDTWGHHLRQIRDELNHEALQFVKEQRIRCLLVGSWFPTKTAYKADVGPVTQQDLTPSNPTSYRYVKLSHNRRYLHYADFNVRGEDELGLDTLHERIDLRAVNSVTSNVTASSAPSTPTLPTPTISTTKITIHGRLGRRSSTQASHPQKDIPLLTLNPATHTLASEWLDGLLMVLNQQPITNETDRLVGMVRDYGLKIRLLNVRFDELGLQGGGEVAMPSREGVEDEFWYEIAGE